MVFESEFTKNACFFVLFRFFPLNLVTSTNFAVSNRTEVPLPLAAVFFSLFFLAICWYSVAVDSDGHVTISFVVTPLGKTSPIFLLTYKKVQANGRFLTLLHDFHLVTTSKMLERLVSLCLLLKRRGGGKNRGLFVVRFHATDSESVFWLSVQKSACQNARLMGADFFFFRLDNSK